MGLKKYFSGSGFLNFIKGMGSIIDMTGTYFISEAYSMRTPQEQDALALRGDWEAVGNDLRHAMDKHKKSLLNKLKN